MRVCAGLTDWQRAAFGPAAAAGAYGCLGGAHCGRGAAETATQRVTCVCITLHYYSTAGARPRTALVWVVGGQDRELPSNPLRGLCRNMFSPSLPDCRTEGPSEAGGSRLRPGPVRPGGGRAGRRRVLQQQAGQTERLWARQRHLVPDDVQRGGRLWPFYARVGTCRPYNFASAKLSKATLRKVE